MRIFVTGATGFLGSALCATLRAAGHELVAVGSRDSDLRDGAALARFDHLAFDQIFHLAAWTQAGDFCIRHPGQQWLVNQQINTNLLAWWQRAQPQAKLICMGTSCAYSPALELIEENYLDGLPIDSLFTYAYTKRMLYVGARALAAQYGMKYLCLVPSTLYGPGYHTDGRQMHFIFDLIRKILRGKHYGEPVVLWGDGHQCRELVWRGDFIDLMLRLNAVAENELINIGAGEEHSIRHFAELICARVGYDAARIDYDTGKYVGAKSKCLSVAKQRRLAPDYAMTPLADGLADTIRWFEQCALGERPKDLSC